MMIQVSNLLRAHVTSFAQERDGGGEFPVITKIIIKQSVSIKEKEEYQLCTESESVNKQIGKEVSSATTRSMYSYEYVS